MSDCIFIYKKNDFERKSQKVIQKSGLTKCFTFSFLSKTLIYEIQNLEENKC